jgi:hypothetical protein
LSFSGSFDPFLCSRLQSQFPANLSQRRGPFAAVLCAQRLNARDEARVSLEQVVFQIFVSNSVDDCRRAPVLRDDDIFELGLFEVLRKLVFDFTLPETRLDFLLPFRQHFWFVLTHPEYNREKWKDDCNC